jgi:hypothetical protein
MSPDEQDAIIGKTVREKAALDRTLATLDKELRDLSTYFKDLHDQIRQRIAYDSEPNPESIIIPPAVRKYADLSKLVSLLDERDNTNRQLQTTVSQLEKMGVR